MPLPPEPVLRAALRWLEHLPSSDIARTRALFTSHHAFTDITPTQYTTALTWLQEHGLTRLALSEKARSTAIFEAATGDALWFPEATTLITSPTDLPEDALRAAEALGLENHEALAAIHHAWGKVDTAERARVGSAGEHALVEILSGLPDVEVRHVAAESDGYGYDIDVRAPGGSAHLEVKATTRRGRLRIHLSRHEYDTMRRDRAWALVAIRLDQELKAIALATPDLPWLAAAGPMDRIPGALWESLRLDVPPNALTGGVPILMQILAPPHIPLLRGEPCWPG